MLLYCSKELFRKKEFILNLIKINNRLLEYLPNELKTDEEFFLEAALTVSNVEIFVGNESLYNQVSRVWKRYKAHKSHIPHCILPEIAHIIAKYSN